MWIDPDLGCSEDDYIGCDTSRSLMYIYNQDEVDGDVGCDCTTGGGTTYCEEVPILGCDYFRGPRKPVREIDTFRLTDLPLDKIDYPNIYDTIGYVGDSLIILDLDKQTELGCLHLHTMFGKVQAHGHLQCGILKQMLNSIAICPVHGEMVHPIQKEEQVITLGTTTD
jgi:hypothetical protein